MTPDRLNAGDASPATRAPAPAGLLDIRAVAALCGVSTRTVRRLVDEGRVPAPTRLGRCVRWPRAVVETWLAEGCPNTRKRGARR